MIILVSEICRLILGFLEEEQLFESYNSFLKECQFLNECQIYIRKGIQFSTKIHGKTLRQFLSDYDFNPLKNSQTQTESVIDLLSQSLKNEAFTQTDHLKNEQSLFNTETVPKLDTINNQLDLRKDIEKLFDFNQFESICSRPRNKPKNKRKKKFSTFNRSSLLLTPTKKNKFHDESKSSSDTDTNESILDINYFIKNLCDNDFPEQLAKSINEIKIKKHPANSNETSVIKNPNEPLTTESVLEKKLTAFIPKIIPKNCPQLIVEQDNNIPEIIPIEQPYLFEYNSNVNKSLQTPNICVIPDKINEEVNNIDLNNKNEILHANLDENLSKILNNQPVDEISNSLGLLDFDLNQFSIGNEDISYLADCFSEPAFASLYEAINTSQINLQPLGSETITLNDSETISEAYQSLNDKEDINISNSIIKETEVKENETVLPQPSEQITDISNLKESEASEDLISRRNEENPSLSFSLSENKKSRIIIAKSESQLNLKENQLKSSLKNIENTIDMTTDPLINASKPIDVKVSLPINNLEKSETAAIIMSPNLTDIGSAMVKNEQKVMIIEKLENKLPVNTAKIEEPIIIVKSSVLPEINIEKDIEMACSNKPLENEIKTNGDIIEEKLDVNVISDAQNETIELTEPLTEPINKSEEKKEPNLTSESQVIQSEPTEVQESNEIIEKIPTEIKMTKENDTNTNPQDSKPQKNDSESEKVIFFLDTSDEYTDQSNLSPTKINSISNSKLTINLSPDTKPEKPDLVENSANKTSTNSLAGNKKGSNASLDTSYSAPPTPKLNTQPSQIDLLTEDQDDKNLTSQEVDTTWTENDQKTPPPPITPVKKIGYETLQAIKQSLLSTSSTKKKTSTPSKLRITPKLERLNEQVVKRISLILEEKPASDNKNVSLEDGELDSDVTDLPKAFDPIKEDSKLNDCSLSYTSESSASRSSPFVTKDTFKIASSGVSSFSKKLEGLKEPSSLQNTSKFNVDEIYSIAQRSFSLSKGATMRQILESNGKLNDSSILFNPESTNRQKTPPKTSSDKPKRKRDYFEDFTKNIKDDSEGSNDAERPVADSNNDKRFKYYQYHNYDSDKDNENDYRSYRRSSRYREASSKSSSNRASSQLRSAGERGSSSSRYGSRRESDSNRAQSCSQRNEYGRKYEDRNYSRNRRH